MLKTLTKNRAANPYCQTPRFCLSPTIQYHSWISCWTSSALLLKAILAYCSKFINYGSSFHSFSLFSVKHLFTLAIPDSWSLEFSEEEWSSNLTLSNSRFWFEGWIALWFSLNYWVDFWLIVKSLCSRRSIASSFHWIHSLIWWTKSQSFLSFQDSWTEFLKDLGKPSHKRPSNPIHL